MRPADLTRAANMALRVLAERRIDVLPVDPLGILRACRDTTVMTYADAADLLGISVDAFARQIAYADAVTFRQDAEGKTEYIVAYDPAGNPARLRFTLAHELGHRLLGHAESCAAAEEEADCFASHLLCPEPVLACLRARGMASPDQIAVVCYVSRACAKMLTRRRAPVLDPTLVQAVDELLTLAAAAARPVIAGRQMTGTHSPK